MASKTLAAPLGSSVSISAQVVIIGAGLSGSLAAILLGRLGFSVALIDIHETYPPDFRAEQLVGYQVQMLSKLGLLEIVAGDALPAKQAIATRAGRTVGVVVAPHYGIFYEDMVNRARRNLPSLVRFINAKVVGIELSAVRQTVQLSDGGVVEGRLVIVATGLGQRLLNQAGLSRTVIQKAQSLAFGFDIGATSGAMFGSSVMVAYGESTADKIDYLTLFRVGDRARGNLFTYHDPHDPWVRQFLQNPSGTLHHSMPSLRSTIGALQINGGVQFRVNDLSVASGYRRDGLVVVGDGFQTSCPAAGTGIGRLLTDIDLLCGRHIPQWLATDGMPAEKINRFYDDFIKRASDAEALRVAKYRRSATVETSWRWRAHRKRVALQRQFLATVSGLAKKRNGRALRASWGASGMAPTPLHR